jgi:leucyl aminopeptidase
MRGPQKKGSVRRGDPGVHARAFSSFTTGDIMRKTLAATWPALGAVLFSRLICAPAVAADKVWISLGDAAYAELKAQRPALKPVRSVDVPVQRVRSGRVPGLDIPGVRAERVHLVQVDESWLAGLSEAVHHKLKRCGGFMAHATEAEGRAQLQQLARVSPTLTQGLIVTRPSYVIDQQTVVNPMLSQMQATNIAQTITDLSTGWANRHYQTAGGIGASDWLKTRWASLAGSRTDITVEQFTHAAWKQKSVILTMRGTDNAGEIVVLGAHLDAINSAGTTETTKAPGADDDASGVASLTEIIRVLSSSNYKPRRTLKFMAYAAEEVGLKGSAEIANSFAAASANVVGVMQLDMTNYKGAANDIYIFTDYTDSSQNTFVTNLIKTYQPTLTVGTDRCGYACSDHASWSAKGYYATMPFESSMGGSNKSIHTTNDTLASSGGTANHALKFARMGLSYAVELGSDGPAAPPPPTTDKTETFTGSLSLGQTRSFGPFKAGVGTFKASTTGSGDIDLYARKGAVPTTSSYTCKSDGMTSTETCSISMTANGDVYVLLKGYSPGTYALTVSYKSQ